MATRIVFAAGGEKGLSIRVEEDPTAVFSAWAAAGGHPFGLTRTAGSSGSKVWIHPSTVAYWHEAEPQPPQFA